MKETVLYYTPQPTKQSRTLKGILVRMGIRIRNISPQQVNQTVGMLAGVPGFEEKTDATADTLEANKTNADALSSATPAADTVKASPSQPWIFRSVSDGLRRYTFLWYQEARLSVRSDRFYRRIFLNSDFPEILCSRD